MLDKTVDNTMKNTPFSAPRWLMDWVDFAALQLALNRSAWLRQAALEKLERDSIPRPETAVEVKE